MSDLVVEQWDAMIRVDGANIQVNDRFPSNMSRDAIKRAFAGRYGGEVIFCNPSSIGENNPSSNYYIGGTTDQSGYGNNQRASHWGKPIDDGGFGDALVDITKGGIALLGRGLFKGGKSHYHSYDI